MIVSAPTADMFYRFGPEKSIQLLKDAGFDAFDLSLDGKVMLDFFGDDDYLEKAKALREFTDIIGLPCNQSHAPFGARDPHYKDSESFKKVVRSMEVASVMGANGIVIHPLHYLPYFQNVEQLKLENARYYRDLLPIAQRLSITIYTENMWQRNECNSSITHSVCAHPEEFVEYIDMINSPYFKGCLDVGHTHLVGENTVRFIKLLGKERLQALHIHDNDFIDDRHNLPFVGKIDFLGITDALADIGYEGDFTFEAGNYVKAFPEELVPSALRHMCETGRYLSSLIEAKKH